MATIVDLFAGCGGMTAGFVDAGFRPELAVEWDLEAAATYAANFGEGHTKWCDIAGIRSADVPTVDVVIGGPPCQGFSSLGSRDPHDPRNNLWVEYMRVVLAANPQVFVIENVDRFRRSPEFSLLQAELTDGALRRWRHVSVDVLNAADFGVPQRRHRTILIASRVGPVPLPSARFSKSQDSGHPSWRSVSDAFVGVPFQTTGTALPESSVEFFGQRLPGTFKAADLHVGRQPRALSLERYDCIPPGGGRFNLPGHLLPRCWASKPTGTTDVMGRMRWDQPSLTVRTEFFKPEKGQYLHPQWSSEDPQARVNRPISHWEAARLQTFPDHFLWCGSKIGIARQIGNAVPPVLARAIADEVAAVVR